MDIKELNEGMYVRYYDLLKETILITKIVSKCENLTGEYYNIENTTHIVNADNIKKASDKLIDLIEVGDYVNGYLVTFINKITSSVEVNCEWIYSTKDINSVVTKEQFEKMEYKRTDTIQQI